MRSLRNDTPAVRIVYALTGPVELQAVIGALNAIAGHFAAPKGSESMGANAPQRYRSAVFLTKQDYVISEYRDANRVGLKIS